MIHITNLKTHYQAIWTVLLLSVLFLSSCEDCTFTSRNSSQVAVRFYRIGIPQAVSVVFDSITTSRGRRVYLAEDFEGGQLTTGTGAIALPVNPASDTSIFFFHSRIPATGQRITDSLILTHNRQLAVVSPACGYDQRIFELRLVGHSFDSGAIFKNELIIGDTVNVRLFFRN